MQTLSIIIPCFNEAPGIPHLSARLKPVLQELGRTRDAEVIFVDDGSHDATFERLTAEFGRVARIVRHPANLGIAAAMRTGFAAARGDIVCTIDSDCTYEPAILGALIAPIADGAADVVTASPYHPGGAVVNVPTWRLTLSRAASWIYRQVLPTPLYTYTSCCRAYRRAVLPGLAFRDPGFLGVAEMLVAAIQARLRVVEVPARLERRQYGVSKMRTLRLVRGHLGLLSRILVGRLVGRSPQGVTHGAR